jgi:hypothetical protein
MNGVITNSELSRLIARKPISVLHLPGMTFVVVESLMKNCARCSGRFDRIAEPRRRLKDRTWLDPNAVCPGCEAILVKEAVVRAKAPPPPSSADLARWNRECLRKDAFEEAHLARTVAKRMRQRHRGRLYPVSVYRCRIAIDPVLFPDRARPHWHIGNDGRP